MEQLTLPDKLYGREREASRLLDSFARVGRGHGEVLLVPGHSGVGKTALVHELQAPVRDNNGFFVMGKFEQYQQNIPYFAFRQALTELARELQSGDEHQRARYRADILEAVGDLGQLLVDLAPELESWLGAQPPLGDISPREARHRFATVFQSFLKVICRPEHPLVLFIDDWQWADIASFELLKAMEVGTAVRYLLVIVSYRDNEVDSAHVLATVVDDLKSRAIPTEVIQVGNIGVLDVQMFVADTLRRATEDIGGLAALIYGKTRGNPFFTRSFLGYLHESDLIWFDAEHDGWRWRLDGVGGEDLPADVVQLFVRRLHRLDVDSRELLSLAACLGNRFDMDTLSTISGRPRAECVALLFSGPARSMLQPVDDAVGDRPEGGPHVPTVGRFLHDRVQQAAYSLIDPGERPNILLKIGRLLLAGLRPEQLAERLFEVVGDLNAAHHLIGEIAEQVKMVELNEMAARKAYSATAYRSALQFYRAADGFLEQPAVAERLWRDRHELATRLLQGRAECEFLEGNYTEAEECVRRAVAHAETAIEEADVLNTLIVHYTLLARYPEAIDAGRQALAALGISLPEEGYEEARDQEIEWARQELGGRPVSSLVELPVMSRPETLMASKILITMGPPCYRSHQRLWGVIVPKVVNLTLRHGNIPQVGYSHTAFGGLLGWVDGDYSTAREFGELATRLMTDTFRSPSDQSVFYLMHGSSIQHWFKHLKYSTQDYADAYESGVRSGNLQYAAYAFGHNMYCRFYQGVPLETLIQESRRSLAFSRTRLNEWAVDLIEGGLQVFGGLSGEGPVSNGRDSWSEEEYIRRVNEHRNIQVACIYNVLRTCSLLVLGDHDRALMVSDEAEPLIYTVGTQGLLPWPEHVFSRLLIMTALYSSTAGQRKAEWRPELDRMLSALRIWAGNCPENFEHKYLLAAAELAKIDGRPVEAWNLYDKAVEAARAGEFLQWEGMANERACNFWLERGNGRIAHAYWQQAYVCYDRWGAVAKVRAMETEYRADLADLMPANDGFGGPTQTAEPGVERALLENQVAQLRTYAAHVRQDKLRITATTQAEELAQALERLRGEVSERKRMEEVLRESEGRFRTIFEEAPMGVALIDSLTGRIHEVNPRFAEIAGRSRTEMAAIDWMSITHPDDVQEDMENMARLNAGEITGYTMTKRYRRPDDTYVWVSMTIAPMTVEDNGHPRHLCMVEDITERKQAEEALLEREEQLRQSQKMEAVGQLAGGIAHDFNNILTAVIGYSDLVLADPEFARTTWHDDVAETRRAAERASLLTKQILAFSRRQALRPTVVSLNEVLARMAPLLRRTLGENIALVSLESPELGHVEVDVHQLEQVLLNLAVNARDAMIRGGRLTLETANVDLDE
ncbi:MAG: AAA family ATPase [Thermoleophilia bacterium]